MSDPLGLIRSTSSGISGGGNAGFAAGGVGGAGMLRGGKAAEGGAEAAPSFKDVLMKNIEQVNKLQQDAETAIEDLASGKRDDLDGVMMAKRKADMAFSMLVQVRNKLVDAYEEIKQMRV